MKKYLLILFIFLTINWSGLRAEAIKIGLQTDVTNSYVASSVPAQIINMKTNRQLYKIEPMKIYPVKTYGDSILIEINRKYYNLGTDSITIKPTGKGFVSTKKHWYRGELIVYNINEKLTLINNLNIEEYLLGVVPSEMPSKWNEEALKAQAIAARSYAIANLGKHGSKRFDLKDNTEDQAYGGASVETQQTNKAVIDTLGIVVTYNHQIISAYYHASAGGQTNNSGSAWSRDLPYLRSVPSFDSGIRKMGHGIGMSQYGANNLAQQGYNAYQILTYFYNNIKFGKLKPEWNL